jgi:hypothetical protein
VPGTCTAPGVRQWPDWPPITAAPPSRPVTEACPATWPPFLPPGAVADALTYSDTTTGPRGETVNPGPGYEEIIDRHGSDSLVARSRVKARVDIFGAVIRTLRRVSSARPNQQAFSVEAVFVGCASLQALTTHCSCP